MITNMFCNICLERSEEYMEMPCGHDICGRCAKESAKKGKEEYRCTVCLEMHQTINAANNERRLIVKDDSELEGRLFCLDCYESFEFVSLKNGRHRTHNVSSLRQSLPHLKEIALSQLNKTLILQNTLLLCSQKDNDDIYLREIENLSQQIHRHFQQERQLLLTKEQQLNKHVQEVRQSVCEQLQRRREAYIRLYEQVHEVNETLEGFISNPHTFDQLEALHLFKQTIDRDFLSQLKDIQKQTIQLPKFIAFSTLQQYLNTNILLKPQQTPSQLPLSEHPSPISSKRVSLRSKINKKLYCY